jgi:hypothetical protein
MICELSPAMTTIPVVRQSKQVPVRIYRQISVTTVTRAIRPGCPASSAPGWLQPQAALVARSGRSVITTVD